WTRKSPTRWAGSRALLGEQPLHHGWRPVGRHPGAVAFVGILSVQRPAAGLLQRLDHVPAATYLHCAVEGAMEDPDGDLRDLFRLCFVAAAADGNRGGK